MTFLTSINRFTTQYRPQIMTGMGIFGMVGTIYLSVVNHQKILKTLKKTPEDRLGTNLQNVKLYWPLLVAPGATFLGSTYLICEAQNLSTKRLAALGIAYNQINTHLNSWVENVPHFLTDQDMVKLRGKIQNSMSSEPEPDTPHPDTTLFFDTVSGRYFEFESIEKIRNVIIALNEELYSSDWVGVNDFYDEVGLPPIQYGDDLGWWSYNGSIKICFEAALTPNNRPCVGISFQKGPNHINDRTGV